MFVTQFGFQKLIRAKIESRTKNAPRRRKSQAIIFVFVFCICGVGGGLVCECRSRKPVVQVL